MAQPAHDPFTILEAVDHLSTIVELDEDALTLVKSGREDQWKGKKELRWLDPKKEKVNRDTILAILRVVYHYLKDIYDKDRTRLQDPETQKGIEAIMGLIGEAGRKIDQYTKLFKKSHGIVELVEYKELQKLYLTKIIKRFREEVVAPEEAPVEKVDKRGIQNLDEVVGDRKYELFYISQEDGRPFFDRELLGHIQMVGAFDHLLIDYEMDDPLLEVKDVFDRDIYHSAREILRLAAPHIDEFCKEALRHKKQEFVGLLLKALMALMLAGNGRNLIYHSQSKSCAEYYIDFHTYLRKAVSCPVYRDFIEKPPKSSSAFHKLLINLSHIFCSSFFMRVGSNKDTLKFIHKLIDAENQEEEGSFWQELIERDQNMRSLLARYPSGPLMRALDILQGEKPVVGFDPLSYANLPSQLYSIAFNDVHATFLRLPCPTKQTHINNAEVVAEFEGLLRYFQNRKHLIINMQNRTSWEEHARCQALERIEKMPCKLLSLPCHTDFYEQSEDYKELNNANSFKKLCVEQVEGGPLCGFVLPPELMTIEFGQFIPFTLDQIHQLFFEGRNVLSLKERRAFIDLFYHLIALKALEVLSPDTVSFTNKDALDESSSATTSFFAMMRLFTEEKSFSAAEKDFILWMLYAPALVVRERAIDEECFKRMVSWLSHFQNALLSHRKEIVSGLSKLYSADILKNTNIERML